MSTISASHLAPGRRLPVRAVDSVVAEAGRGLVGDRYHGSKHRHVTIQSQELRVLESGTLHVGDPVEWHVDRPERHPEKEHR